jgi:SP family sugar:H+ symporter-like MFS transporter
MRSLIVYHPSGSLAQSLTTDRMGRRDSIFVWTIVFTIGVVIQTATTYSIVQITLGRFVAGLGVGALSGLSPLLNYVSC